jgi:LacI family transcriptional regulator
MFNARRLNDILRTAIKVNKEERRQRIVHLIEQSDQNQLLGTRELAAHLDVSEMTVRRDLRELSREGLLLRRHGGAEPMRRLHIQEKKEIGVLLVSRTEKYSDPFFNAVLEGADRRLQELGYRIAYVTTRAEVNSAEKARALLQSPSVSGIILVGGVSDEVKEYFKANMRALVVTTGSIGPDFDEITFDGHRSMGQLVDHLVQRGYRRLGFITGKDDSRLHGFIDGVHVNGLPTEADLCLIMPSSVGGWTPEMGHAGAQQLLSLANPPDAILCASDLVAIGAIQWLHQHKLRVPEDVAVTGFDNIPESAFTAPSLTTVHVHKQLIGALAAERVVKRVENEDEIPLLIQTPTYLVIRRSSAGRG